MNDDAHIQDWTQAEPVMEAQLRPSRLQGFVGQQRIRTNLEVYIAAARQREGALDHVLFHGPPGLGKTTLAHIIATELGVPLSLASGPALERPKDLAALLTQVAPRGVLFIDEIHRMPTQVEEILYSAMEDFEIVIMVGEGPTARSVKLPLQPFTLVGATTRASLLSKPLRDRFGIREKLDYYDQSELRDILQANAQRLDLELGTELVHALSQRSRGTPRIAIQLLKRVRDFVQVQGQPKTEAHRRDLFARIGVDDRGLLPLDREFLDTLAHKFSGGPTGLSTLAAAMGEDSDTLESYVEPYLIREGLIERTPRGRRLTVRGYEHLGLSVPLGMTGPQSSLFAGSDGESGSDGA